MDGVVAAAADAPPGGIVVTSDPDGLRALAAHATHPITIVGV